MKNKDSISDLKFGFDNIYTKAQKLNESSNYLDFNEVQPGMDCSSAFGVEGKIVKKGTWEELTDKSPESYGFDADDPMLTECVLVSFNGKKEVFVYDESGVRVERSKSAESKESEQENVPFTEEVKDASVSNDKDSKYLSYEELTDFPYDGEEYFGEKVKVLAKGTFDELEEYNDSGFSVSDFKTDDNMPDNDPDLLESISQCVGVELPDGSNTIYVYGGDGVQVKRNKLQEDDEYLSYEDLKDFPYMGEDSNGDKVIVLDKGSLDDLENYNVNHLGPDSFDDDIDECVAVKDSRGRKTVFVYGPDGVLVRK